MKRSVAIIPLVLLLSTVVQAQNSARRGQPKTYWLSHSLIFIFGCEPRIYPGNIIFTDGYCSTDGNAIYGSRILVRGSKVEVRSITGEKGFARLSFKHASEDYEILLKNSSQRSFRASFNLLFSEREVLTGLESCPKRHQAMLTKRDVIKCMGFPITARRVGGVEEYFYIIEFVGYQYYGYDGYTVRIRNNRVIDVSGYI